MERTIVVYRVVLAKLMTLMKQKILISLLLFLAQNLFSQTKQTIDSEAITDRLYQHASDDTPGMAVGIVKDGKIIYENYLGYANLEHQIAVDKNTRFNIASNAKQYTALCILKLKEGGKINLEDDLRKYLPGLYPDIQEKITISNLLTHTSGVRDYCDLLALTGKTWWKQFIDNGDVMELLLKQKDLNFKPGTEYLYSNSNYILLTEIIKNVTGQDFSEYAKNMFEGLDISSTQFLTNYMSVIPHKARPYGNWGAWREEPTITEVHGDGALFTTLRDQLKWEQIIQLNDGEYLSQKLITESQSPLESSIENSYGYGLEFGTFMGRDYSYHNGSTSAYNATFLRFPVENTSIVVMSNNRSVPSNYLARQIAQVILGFHEEQKKEAYPANPEKVEKLKNIKDVLGAYEGRDGTIVRITEKNDSLYREIYHRESVKLIQEKESLFGYETIEGLKMNFTNISKPGQQFTLYMASQEPNTYYKISDSNLMNDDKSELNGRFYNEETNTEIILKHKEGDKYSLIKNGRERNAQLILEDYLRMMDVYKIRVIRDEENKVIGLNVDRGRVKNVIFNKI